MHSGSNNVSRSAQTKIPHDRLPCRSVLLLCAATVALSAAVSAVLTSSRFGIYAAWLICSAAAAFAILTSKKFSTAAAVILLFAFISPSTAAVTVTAAVSGYIILIGIFSTLTASFQKKHVLIVLASFLLSCAAMLAVSRSIPVLAVSAVLLLSSALMGYAMRRGKSRTFSVACFVGLSACAALVSATVLIWLAHGGISADGAADCAEYLRSSLSLWLTERSAAMGGSELAESIAQSASHTAEMLVNLLPGLLVLCLTVAATVSGAVQRALFSSFELDGLLDISRERLTLSPAGATVFILSYIFTFTSSPTGRMSFISAAAENLCLVFIPTLAVTAFYTMRELLQRVGLLAIVICAAVIMLALFSSASALYLFALIGAFRIIVSGIDSWAKEHYGKGDNV